MIRAVVFDWGGVIQRTVDLEPRRQLNRELGLPPGGVECAVFESAIWEEASLGKCAAQVAWATIAASVGYPAERADEFVERFFAGDRVDRALLRLVRHLRSQGLRTGLLSNAPPPRSTRVGDPARWGMDGLFDAQVFSYQVGALKPDPLTYRAILQALSALPRETLFIDDSEENVRGALAMGMDAVRFVETAPFLADLSRRGLSLPPTKELPG